MQRAWRLIQLVACFGACDAAAHLEADGLRVGTWNITFYDGGFASEVGAVVYGQFEGRSFAPDLLVMQEFSGTTAALGFLAALNSHPESPGDWELAPFLDVGDLNVVVYYRESQLDLEQRVLLSPNFAGGPARAVQRWDFRLDGYASEQASLSVYGVHFKAGSTPSDQSRRLVEAEIIRQDAASLPVGRPFLLAGDLNIQSSSQAAYQTLVERIASVDPVGRGQLFDPILTPGEWQNNSAFRYVHTQDPATQVDDRYDQILLSGDLINGDGLEYIGDPTRAYSTTTWDDPNHSYRAWGNDGTTYNRALRLDGNAMVGRDIAADITTLCFGGGHMPVFLDLQVPARLAVAEQIDVGRITPGTTVRVPVANGADIARWGESGIDALRFFAFGSAGVDVPFEFVEVPPAETATVEATLTGDPGPFSGTLTIASNDPDRPDVEVLLTGTLIEDCIADVNGDGTVEPDDFSAWVIAFNTGGVGCDQNGDGLCDPSDFNAWAANFLAGCP